MRTVNIKPLKFVNPHTMRTVNMRIIQDRFQELITRAERVGLLKDDGYDIMTTDEHERPEALERENRELRRANEILKTASAFFAQAELDRRLK